MTPHKGNSRLVVCNGEAQTRQLHSIPITASGSGDTTNGLGDTIIQSKNVRLTSCS